MVPTPPKFGLFVGNMIVMSSHLLRTCSLYHRINVELSQMQNWDVLIFTPVLRCKKMKSSAYKIKCRQTKVVIFWMVEDTGFTTDKLVLETSPAESDTVEFVESTAS